MRIPIPSASRIAVNPLSYLKRRRRGIDVPKPDLEKDTMARKKILVCALFEEMMPTYIKMASSYKSRGRIVGYQMTINGRLVATGSIARAQVLVASKANIVYYLRAARAVVCLRNFRDPITLYMKILDPLGVYESIAKRYASSGDGRSEGGEDGVSSLLDKCLEQGKTRYWRWILARDSFRFLETDVPATAFKDEERSDAVILKPGAVCPLYSMTQMNADDMLVVHYADLG